MRGSRAAVIVLVIACNGNEAKPVDKTDTSTTTPTPPTPTNDLYEKGLVDLEDFRTRMCACNDVPCTDTVFEEFKKWRVEIRARNAGNPPPKDQEQKARAIDKAMRACRANVTAKPGSASTAGSAGRQDRIEAALVDLDSFRSKMCACKDKACADAVQTDYATWQRNLRTKMVDKPDKPDAQQEARNTTIENAMKECRKKAETGTPGAPGGGSKIDAMLVQLQGFRDKICACTAKDCATKLAAEMQTWREQLAKDKELADAKPTADQDTKAVRLQAEIKTCTGKLK